MRLTPDGGAELLEVIRDARRESNAPDPDGLPQAGTVLSYLPPSTRGYLDALPLQREGVFRFASPRSAGTLASTRLHVNADIGSGRPLQTAATEKSA